MMEILSREMDFRFFSATSDSYAGPNQFRKPGVEVSLILEGGLSFVVDGGLRAINAPCATLQAYRENLRVLPGASLFTRTMWCRFAPEGLSEDDWTLLGSMPAMLPIPTLMPALFTSALVVGEVGRSLSQEETAARSANFLGKTILAEYLRNGGARRQLVPLPAAVKRVKQVLDENYASRWTVSRLAQLAGVNANYLISLFRVHIGVTPICYLWERRLDAGLAMLRTSSFTVEDISFRCGFQSPAHFSRRVKQRSGVSPNRLRKS